MSTQKPNILIVDDDTLLLDMYSIKFRESGFGVDIAKNGHEALEKIENGNEFDLILIDIVMPEMDGFELIEKFAAQRTGETPKLVVLSNQGQDSDIKRATEVGADGYIIKANTVPSEVVEKVREFVDSGIDTAATQ